MNSNHPQTGIIAWFAQNPVAANLLMFALLFGGILVIKNTKSEVFPEIDPRTITITVEYPGATPQEVEDGITRRIEDAVMGLEGIDRVTSAASEGMGTVTLEVSDFIDKRSVKEEVQAAVERLKNFPPEDANEPRVTIVESVSPVMKLIVSGDVGESKLKQTAEQLRRDLLADEEISIVTLQGARDYEIAIEVSQDVLTAYGLKLEQVAAAVRASSVNLSLGTVHTSSGDILLRTNAEAKTIDALADIIVLSDSSSQTVRLGDIAEITDSFVEQPLKNTYNGKAAVFLQVDRAQDEDSFEVKQAVAQRLASYSLPAGVSVTSSMDTTEVVGDRVNLLVRNAIMGLALVFVFLALTLDLRLAVWTSIGIPSAFLGGFILFGQFTTINMTSLLGLIVVLGIVVDDAIVVGENIHEQQTRYGSGILSAINGARGVFIPVLVGVTTSMVAFGSLLQSSGIIGQLLQPVALVVLAVLFVSLVEAFLILPGHLAHGGDWSTGPMLQVKNAVGSGLNRVRDTVFVPLASLSVRFPYVVIAVAFSLLLVTAGVLSGGHIRFIFFPTVEGDEIKVSLEMPAGTPYAQTEYAMQRVISALDTAVGEQGSGLYRSLSVTVGGRLSSNFGSSGTEQRSEIANATLELSPAGARDLTSAEIERRWRDAIGQIPGVKSLTFESSGISSGADISYNLSHPHDELLVAASSQLVKDIEAITGVGDIESTGQPGKRQIEFSLTAAGAAAGLTVDDLSRSIRRAYFGEEVQRFQRDGEEVEVFIRFPKTQRDSLVSLARMKIPTKNGGEIALGTAASIRETRSFVTIDRVDGQRVITISADVDENITTSNMVNELLQASALAKLKSDFPGISVTSEGQARSQKEEMAVLLQNFLIAMLIIYALIASVLKSYLQPLIIMAIIPFGLVGAIVGHMLLGFDLSFLSLFGVVALSGVIINDSIVLIDYFNELEKAGGDRLHNIVEAVRRRFRPILITTLTTFIGLVPMIAETSIQAQFLIPMALSIAFGILFSSFLILVLVPACISLAKRY
ncbi:MAG: efflux RND transporter permease subunit [Paraglaciecola sp.]|nr:efflux RND transporter permease subunit [Paraglaciecola sp.]